MTKLVTSAKYIVVPLVAFLLFSCKAQELRESDINKPDTTVPGQAVLFNDDWQFSRGGTELTSRQLEEQENWEAITLPHTPRIEPKAVNDQWQEIAWYKKTFEFQPGWSEKNVFLKFEGAMNEARVAKWQRSGISACHRRWVLDYVRLPFYE